MSNSDALSQLERLLGPSVDEHGLFLESVTLTGPTNRKTLRLTVDLADGPGGVDSDVLEQLTRAISAILDERDPISGAYSLEVSTPGVDRPLTTPRHFRRNESRLVDVHLLEGEQAVTGRIVSATEETLVLETESGPQEIPLKQIRNAQVKLEFRRGGKAGNRGN